MNDRMMFEILFFGSFALLTLGRIIWEYRRDRK